MLIPITDYCSMGCSHCLSSCTIEGKHITKEQLVKNLDYAYSVVKNTIKRTILITGGEPFEHPEIKDVLEIVGGYAKKYPTVYVFICTNGVVLANDNKLLNWYREYIKRYKNVLTQVVNYPEYYPQNLTEKNIYYLSKIQRGLVATDSKEMFLYPQGRALDLPSPVWGLGGGPKCGNLRLTANQMNTTSFRHVIQSMPMVKLCVPRINIDGSIALGESRLCPTIGSIEDDDKVLFENTKNCRCSRCKIACEFMKENNSFAYSLIFDD